MEQWCPEHAEALESQIMVVFSQSAGGNGPTAWNVSYQNIFPLS